MRNTPVLVAALVALALSISPGVAAEAPTACDAPYTGCLAACGNCAEAGGVANAHNCGATLPDISKTTCVQICKSNYVACQTNLPGPARAYERETDRRGGDYFNTTMGQTQTWRDCSVLCLGDAKCLAWTFVKAGIQHPTNPRCWLKSRVLPAVKSSCCTSGVKGAR